MAILHPEIEIIKKIKPEPGELHLIKFLSDVLDDSYEIYFQPYLNGDRPDIVVLRKDTGILIIEVKDWDLTCYNVNNHGKWCLKAGTKIKSPLTQVMHYKENIFNLHIDDLLSKKIKNPKIFCTVTCAVYFHNFNENYLNNFMRREQDCKYSKWLNYFVILGKDSLTEKNIIGWEINLKE